MNCAEKSALLLPSSSLMAVDRTFLAPAIDVAAYFELDAAQAREIALQVARPVSKGAEAARHGISKGRNRTDGLRF